MASPEDRLLLLEDAIKTKKITLYQCKTCSATNFCTLNRIVRWEGIELVHCKKSYSGMGCLSGGAGPYCTNCAPQYLHQIKDGWACDEHVNKYVKK